MRRTLSERTLANKQTALVLYSVLVVLPAVVFGGLHWHSLLVDHRTQLAQVPDNAEGAAGRLKAGIKNRVRELVEREDERPFYYYQREYYVEGRTGDVPFVPSPLVAFTPPRGIKAWFAYDWRDGRDAEIEIIAKEDNATEDEWQERERMRRLIRDIVRRDFRERVEIQYARLKKRRGDTMSLKEAAVNVSSDRDLDCLKVDVRALSDVADHQVDVWTWDFYLRLVRDKEGRPHVFATRRIQLEAEIDSARLPECFEVLAYTTTLVQGFFIDTDWFLSEMPLVVASEVLSGTQRFLLGDSPSDATSPTDVVVTIPMFEELDVEVEAPEDVSLGDLKIAVDTGFLKERFHRQAWRFLGVAAMMIISLFIGMGLLVRSVRSSLDEARRTENFVASVTHELRTPIAAVKLYAEMLQEGWITQREKQADYFSRIVAESNRLDTLVDRVLEKRKLGDTDVDAHAGDLGEVVEAQIPDLKLTAGTYGNDLNFKIEPDLPRVLLIEEAVHSILTNLVENARKYAPVDPNDENAEPILVQTRMRRGKVVLEVMDRGAGIPEDERLRVFEAFYRIGDERTRTAPGTGLGLHLVALQARAMKARAQALPRRGGGSVFRVTFRTA